MADSLLIDVDKVKNGTAPLEALPSALERRIARENRTTAQRVVLDARSRVHVRFGFLRDAIDWVQAESGDIWIGLDRKAKFPIPGATRSNGRAARAVPSLYAHLVEHGSERSHAYPFLNPAVKSEESSHERRIVEAMIDAADDVGLGAG